MASTEDLVFVGCFSAATGGTGAGITRMRRDRADGRLYDAELAAVAPDCNFLAVHPLGHVLYATNSGVDGTVSSYAIDDEGALSLTATVRTGASTPCHLCVSPDGRWLAVANFRGESVSLHPLDKVGVVGAATSFVRHRGRGTIAIRQDAPRPHNSLFSPDSRLLYVADFGLDVVYAYVVSAGTLVLADAYFTGPGSGPRSMASDGRRLLVAAELAALVGTLQLAPEGRRYFSSTVPSLAEAYDLPSEVSEIAFAASGTRVVLANRGANVLTVFAVGAEESAPTGNGHSAALRPMADLDCGGDWPRHFTVVENDLYVCNQHSDELSQLRLHDWNTLAIAGRASVPVASPACVVVVRRNARTPLHDRRIA